MLIGWQMANTFIDLNDTPSDYTGFGSRFVRVNANATELVFGQVELNDLADVQTNAAYVPSAGQTLIYSAAAGVWRPGSLDVYSAGNGLSKSALTLNVAAGISGGLTSNTNGVFITDISNVSGTWGNTSYIPVITVNSKGQITNVTPTLLTATQATTITNSFVGNVNGTSGQISVVGGKGNNSNATLNLVATGVTAGTYGSTTHTPRITVDTYGRIQQVDTVEITGGGGGNVTSSLGFSKITVAGQTQVAAEVAEDTLTLVAGTGISITTNANADSVTFATNVSFLAANVANNIDVADLRDVDATGITNGQVLVWNSSTSKFEAGNMSGGGGSNVDLTDFSITTASPSGNGSLTYNNAGVFTFTPAAVSAVTQSLSWNASTYVLSLSSGNSVNLSVLKDTDTDSQTLSLNGNIITISGSNSSVNLTSMLANVGGGSDSQTLSLSGNIITISGSNSNVNLTSALGNVAGNYGDSNVVTLLGNVSANIVPSANNIYSLGNSSNRWKELHLSGNTIYIAGATVSGDSKLKYNGSNLATESYVTSAVSGAAGNYGNSNVALYLSDNSYATQTYVTTQINTLTAGAPAALNTLAEIANALNNSNSTLATVAFTGNHSSLSNRPTMSLASNTYLLYDDSNVNLSSVIGQQGIQGNTGVSVASGTVNGSGNLILTLSNASTVDVGNVRGTNGTNGANGTNGVNGVSVSNASITANNLIITLSNSTTIDAGNVRGPQGIQGLQGDGNAGIANATVAGNNELIIGLVNGTYVNAGNVRGPIGLQGNAGINGANGTNGVGITSVSLVSSNLVLNYSNTSTQDVGNIRGPQGNAGTNGVNVSSATVNGSGNLILTLSNAATVDAGNVRGTNGTNGANGIQLANISVTSNSASGNGSLTYSNVTGVFTFTPALGLTTTGVSAGTYGNATTMPQFTVDTYGRITGVSNIAISAGGPGDIEGVTAGTGLSGGGTSGTVTLSLGTSGVTAGTYGNATTTPQFTVDTYGRITGVTNVSISGGGGGSGDITSVVAGNGLIDGGLTGDVTLNVGAGAGITVNSDNIALTSNIITTGAKTYGSASLIPQITVDTYGRVTSVSNVSVSGGGGGSGATIQRFKLNYSTTGTLANTSSLSSGISSVTIDSASGGEVTVSFTGFRYPPGGIMLYGYDRTNNKYLISNLETTMGQREIPGGGSAGSPTAFDNVNNITVKLKLREAETGASRAFGTTTHAWIQFVMYD